MIKRLLPVFGVFIAAGTSLAAQSAGGIAVVSYAATNVTTGAYTTLTAKTALSSSRLFMCDTSGHVVKLAIGSAGNETDLFTLPVSGCFELVHTVPAGARLSVKAIDASATTGYAAVSQLP